MSLNRIGRRIAFSLLALPLALPLALLAQSSVPYARQWPITLSRSDAGAYRVPLQADVYAAAYWPDLHDVRVIDADGKPIASTVHAAAATTTPPLREIALHWFAMPPRLTIAGGDLALMVERNSDGTVTAIRSTSTAQQPTQGAAQAWLIDRGPNPEALHSLTVDWSDVAAPMDLMFRLEGSDDLRDWLTLDPEVHLLQLRNQSQTMRRNRVTLDTSFRYLRLIPAQAQADFVPTGFRGEVSAPIAAESWRWLDVAGSPEPGDSTNRYRYAVQGRYPIERFEVVMPINSTASWNVSSLDAEAGEPSQSNWQPRASELTAWRLSENGHEQRPPPALLGAPVSDHQWRLQQTSGSVLTAAPGLRLGYRDGSVVFLAQGRAPYRLVAGSATVASNQAELEPMLAEMRTRHGAQWQPAAAGLEAGRVLSGDVAYTPTPAARDWKSFLLWAVLALGALLVGGLALSLLRGKPASVA